MPDSLVERIFMLMAMSNINAATLTREAELSNGLITQWKQGKQLPSLDAVTKIANYFKVSIDFLVTGRDHSLSEEDQQLLTAYHSADAGTKSCVNKLLGL